MSDDHIRLLVETSVVLVSSSLVLFCKFCTVDVYKRLYRITMKTFREHKYSSNILRLFLSMSSILKCHFKYMSEKYIKSRLKVYFPIFCLKEVY